ncbi:28S ribosomal protein S28, mitochondrial [Frankliniella occidentalis]|uniref:28S ribosomal protein S28, mitochondrial n=1 Tax=Frankliniella occidentalis TaxID=133901 RepID=A0A6J1SUJ5_FRAOC|nr:28S ribosomal protein S28, mitochondrial [Frankliniella occidentalis]
MAALMHRVLKLSCIRVDKSLSLWKECCPLHSLTTRLISSDKSGSGTPSEIVAESSSSAEGGPNQAVVVENTLPQMKRANETHRNVLKYPTLIKSDAGTSEVSFATLFRESNFAHLGDPRGKTVIGRIYRVVGDDLYIDFDWKFPCVVKRPSQDAHLYVNNAEVRLRIMDLEMSTIFLGAEKETSLNEANCFLVELINSPLGVPKPREDTFSYI